MAKPRKPSGSRHPVAPRRGASTGPMVAAMAGLGVVLVGLGAWIATRPGPAPAAPPVAEEAPRPAPPPPSPPRPAPRPAPPREPRVTEAPPQTEAPPVAAAPATEAPPAAPAGGATARVRGATERAKVVRCIDGDTVELADGRRLRLVGINTPERDRPLYGDAKALLKELVEGHEVTIEWDRERVDQYKRNLGYLHDGPLFVNGELVRRGLAYCYTWEPNTAHHDDLLALQKEARTARAGLWGLPPPRAESTYVADRRGHRFHRPSCARCERISRDRRLQFSTRDAALDAGQNPCDECNP